MRLGVSGIHHRSLARGAAVLLIGGLAAGCSSDVTRFQDSILTGSSRLDPQPAPVQQAYPGDVDQMSTGSVNRGAVRPVGILSRAGLIPRPQTDVQAGGVVSSLPPAAVPNNPYPGGQGAFPAAPQASYPSPASQAVTSATLPPVMPAVDTTVTGTTARAPQVVPVAEQPMPVARAPEPTPPATPPAAAPVFAVADDQGGWTRAGGTQVSVKQGETVNNLSRRFGVPTDAILKANGLTKTSSLEAGQMLVIPTYVHSARAPVSAPDANPDVADARSSTGTRYDIPTNKVPVPGQAPSDRLAVLPQQPRLKEGEPGQQVAATTGAQPAPAASGGYKVVAGDTLHGIAKKTGVSAEAIKQANGLSTGLIRIGQTLVIPAGGAQPATQVAAAPKLDPQPNASVPRTEAAAYTPPQKPQGVIQQAALEPSAPAPDATGIGKMRWPVRGRVISGFGASGGAKNDGIDIAVPTGTPVKAAENGVVIYAGDGLKEFGNTVLVRHEDGLVTVYGHASEINVQRGQKVRRGEEIAKAGMSGSAETPKLHFEVRKDSTPVDPATFLE